MKLNEAMTRNVTVIRPDDTLQAAAQKMKELDVGVLPICDGDRILGMVTDRDIAIRGVAKGVDPRSTRVTDVMTTEVVYIYDDQDVQEAARLMEARQIRRLIVLDRSKRLCGILSLGDIAISSGNAVLAGEVVEQVSEPARPSP